MGSPVKADDFVALSLSGEACDRFKQLLRNNTLLNQLFGWLLDGDGNLSEEAAASIESYIGPIGMIVMWGGSSIPSDSWLVCNGQAVSRTTYPILFERYGTTWGVGDGSTTFNLPNFQDRIPIGAGSTAVNSVAAGGSTVALSINNIPQHRHNVAILIPGHGGEDGSRDAADGGTYSAPLTSDSSKFPGYSQDGSGFPQVSEDLIGSGDAFSIMPPVRGVYFIIKVK